MFEIKYSAKTKQLEIFDGTEIVTDKYCKDPAHLPYMTCFPDGVSYCDQSPRYEFEVEEQYDPPKKRWDVLAVGNLMGMEWTDDGGDGEQWDVNEPTNYRWGADNMYTEHWIKTYTNPHDTPVFIRFKMRNWDDFAEYTEPSTPPTYEEMYYIKLSRQGLFLVQPGNSMTMDAVGRGSNEVYVYAAVPYIHSDGLPGLPEPYRRYRSQLIDGTPIVSVGMGVVHPYHSAANFQWMTQPFGNAFRNYFDLIELPLLWRTDGLKNLPIHDCDGNLIPHGEYYFIDPFAPFPPILEWSQDGYLDPNKLQSPLSPTQNRNTPIRIDCASVGETENKLEQLKAWYEQNVAETCELNRCWFIPPAKWRDYRQNQKTMERIFAEMENTDIPNLEAWVAYNGHTNFPNRTSFDSEPFPLEPPEFWDSLMYEGYCEALQNRFCQPFSNNEQDTVLGKLPIHWLKTTYTAPYTRLKIPLKPTAANDYKRSKVKEVEYACMGTTAKNGETGYVFMPISTEYWMQKKAAFAMLGVEPREEQFSFQWSAPFGGKGQASLSEALAHGWSASLSHSIYNDHHSSAELHCWIPNPRYEKSKQQPDTRNLEQVYAFINDYPHYCIATLAEIALMDDIEFKPPQTDKLPPLCNDIEAPVHYSNAKDWKPHLDSFGCYSGLTLTGQPVPYNGYFPAFNGNGALAAYGNVRSYWEKVNSANSNWTWNNGDFIRATMSLTRTESDRESGSTIDKDAPYITGANGCLITTNGYVIDIENLIIIQKPK